MTYTLTSGDPLSRLATDLDGRLVHAADPNWDTARQAWQLGVDQRPVAVVLAETVRDVQLVLRTAAASGLRVAPQSTGHNARPLGALDDTILLKTAGMAGVRIEPQARLARVEGGTRWMDVMPAAAHHGLAALHGTSRDTGVAGYTLGGGLSWLGRSHGLAANSVVGLEVVTADGSVRRVSAEDEPDLFWALRGGGGSFGVVTGLEFRLYPITEVQAGVLFFPIERASEVLQAWRDWLPSVPDAVTSIGRLLRFPPLPALPPHLSGKSYVVLEATCQLSQDQADALFAPMRALGPVIDTLRPTPVTELSAMHMDPDGPAPGQGDGMLLGDLPAEALDVFASDAFAPELPLVSLELRHLGGALTPGRMSGGALSALDGSFLLFAAGIAPDAAAERPVDDALDTALKSMASWSTGRYYMNFAERRKTGAELFGAQTYERLRQVKAAYDPADVIRANHPIAPADQTRPQERR